MTKLLLVEDDPSLKFIIRRCLEIDRHFVDVVETLGAASAAIELNQYDLLVLDWNLPDGSGLEFCRKCRSNGFTVPVLMLTARSAKSDMVEALDGGADDYISKPFDTQELLARVRALLRRPQAIAPETVTVGQYSLDANLLQLRIGEEAIALAPKEFAIMELLMRQPSKFFPPEMIIMKLWPSSSEADATTLRTHIKNLRKKIDDSDGVLIQSARNRGYSFNPPKES
ncbi:MAG: response regulator transcription factor [Cyanobacteria bacterium REEB67]|nr:response regulator transcription factor [Cyanobacteria bacterium REEB67]